MGTTFEAELLRQLRVHAASEYFFLFRGAPDIIIQSGNAAMICHSEDITTDEDKDAESSGDEAIENCHQRTPLHGLSSTDPPEKVGELFASLHILLVSKILRKVHCGKEIHRKFEVKGLLVDKMCGVIYCSLYVEMRNGESRLKLDMKNYIGCALTPESLCYHIRTITSRELPA